MTNTLKPKPVKYVDYVIDEDGNVEIEANGFTDGACREATKAFEDALGVVKERKMKVLETAPKNTVKVGK